MRNAFEIVVSLKGRDNLRDLGVDVRMILKCILKKESLRMWDGFSQFRMGPQ